jgi:large subunit ribosomal protein L25
MKSVSISGSLRENVGKKDAKAQRAQGHIPCVIYGGSEQLQFVVDETQFQHLLFTPEVKYVELVVR